MAPVWSQYGPLYGFSVVPVWLHYGPSLVPVWYQYRPNVVPACSQYGPIWPQYGSSMVPVCLQYGSSMVPVCLQYGSSMVPVCLQYGPMERRRRDKINNWIVQLSKIIPDCGADNSKTGASKGGILSKACDYVRELRQSNQRLQEACKEAERLQLANELLRQQVEELKSENSLLRAQLQQRGLEGTPEGTPQ
ncbi:upstream stimulatory factor 2-like [Dryobates pubescens]|uniref:upstream stimulatory factor 2-like n=1 Tax=Dryobates pubescens TaxID=118200 RepID=UPI0023B93A7B|nr:upstream stimulatory factor 2-like [Dryobates pubescens]